LFSLGVFIIGAASMREAGERVHIPRFNRWLPGCADKQPDKQPCATKDIVSTSSSAENFRGSFKKI
jgi:hypothetical protein